MSDEPTIPGPPMTDEVVVPPRDPRIGTLIAGKYKIVQKVARGGMARIYKAEQLPLGRIVALKELLTGRDKVESDPEFQARFFLEASTLSKLSHPNTVRVFDYGQHEDAFYMVMEYVEGRTLSRALTDEGAFEPLRALHITIEIVRSLQEAHQHGIVHRDLKPSNVMLVETVEGESIKVLDFGIAKVMQENAQSITMDDRIVGSPRYMAPEQIRHGDIDPRTDIYALGVVLFELLTGKTPYGGDKTLETLMAHLNDPIPSLQARSPYEIPPGLEDLVTSCLAKRPADRPQSVAELKEALREVLLEVAESSTTGSRLTTESLIRHALDRGRNSGSHTKPGVDPTSANQSTLAQRVPVEANRRWMGALGGLLILLGAAATVFTAAYLWMGPPEPVAEATLSDALPPAAPPGVTEVPLHLTSAPAGAEVWEGTRLHGLTPLELPLDPTGPARVFELKLTGYEPTTFRQEPPEPNAAPVTHSAALTPVPPPATAPAPKAAPKRPPKVKPKEELDILNER